VKSLEPTTALEVAEVEDGAVIKIDVPLPWRPKLIRWPDVYVVSFIPAMVLPDETKTFFIDVGQIFKATCLRVPRKISPHFEILRLKVGTSHQFSHPDQPVPADLFADHEPWTSVRFDTASPGVCISMDVHNTSVDPIEFSADLEGRIT
jgi:hypothetical protein